MDVRIAMGQHFFSGFAGPHMTDTFIRNVREHKIGNAILFEYNVLGKEALASLCAEITALITAETGYAPLIALDQEGGAISRLKEDATVFPGAMATAATGIPDYARQAGRITAQELRAMGVNLNLAPVLDVNSNPKNPVIGVRSYGDNPTSVAQYGTAAAQGLLDGGILCCAKHFPGHGDTAVDSHIGLPTVSKPMEALEACELIPFQAAVAMGIPAVMTAHILFPALEPERLPATMSPRIIGGLLRQRMGFQGLVLSDCMMMDAIAAHYGTVAGSVAALRAGVDMVFVSHDAALASEAAQAANQALAVGQIDKDAFAASTARILAAKAALTDTALPLSQVGCPVHRAVSQSITRAAITSVANAPFALGNDPLFIGCARFRPTLAANPEDTSQCFPKTMRALLGGSAAVIAPDPDDAQIEAALAQAAGRSAIVIGLYNATGCTGQRQLVLRAAQLGLPVCAVALRAPYDIADLPPSVCTYAVYDYDLRTMAALADVLCGKQTASGRLPVKL